MFSAVSPYGHTVNHRNTGTDHSKLLAVLVPDLDLQELSSVGTQIGRKLDVASNFAADH